MRPDGKDTMTTTSRQRDTSLEIEVYEGARSSLRESFEEAEDSAAQLDSYLELGEVLIARRAADVVGHLQLVETAAAADIGNLRFYQRCGFRFEAVERDAFIPATGYPDPIEIEGIPLLDRVWLSRER
jgi:hypothetical protein